MGHAPLHHDSQRGNVAEFEGVVWWGEDGLCYVLPHLIPVNVKGCNEVDIADVIAPQIYVHQSGDEVILSGVTVVMYSLYK
ncbi:MAG: hypothetical protein DDT26_00132 [Dehalococcoidia bacterium]|nr:hypothetical protein [Chloroflexota bacterium]